MGAETGGRSGLRAPVAVSAPSPRAVWQGRVLVGGRWVLHSGCRSPGQVGGQASLGGGRWDVGLGLAGERPPVLSGSIDCAGILKLRNSDIELRKGETDIGRKNTRVRLVFRVHIPQPSGRTLSLQVASNPIECCECPRAARVPAVSPRPARHTRVALPVRWRRSRVWQRWWGPGPGSQH